STCRRSSRPRRRSRSSSLTGAGSRQPPELDFRAGNPGAPGSGRRQNSAVFRRYVALGDSTTEGMDDPRPDGTYRGWADRLAERLTQDNPNLLYANLAVRGRRTYQVREEQLGPALALEPDIATVVAGLNDLLHRRYDPDAQARHRQT